MAITQASLTSGSDTTDQQNYSTASVTPSADKLILVSVLVTDNVDSVPATTISGNGLTYVQVFSQLFNAGIGVDRRRLTVFRSMGAAPTAGAISIDAGKAVLGALWSVVEFDGVDTGGTNGSAAVVQSAGARGDAAVTTLTVTLAAFGSASNGAYAAFGLSANQGIQTAGAGWTVINNLGMTSPSTGGGDEWRADNDTTADASWASATTCGGAALEIKAANGIVVPTLRIVRSNLRFA